MGYRIGVPALGQHRDRDDAADALAKLPRLADRIHDLAQEILVAELVTGERVLLADSEVAAEALDFVGSRGAEFCIERIARLELRTIDQQRAGPREAFPIFAVIAKQRETALVKNAIALSNKTRDEVVDQL